MHILWQSGRVVTSILPWITTEFTCVNSIRHCHILTELFPSGCHAQLWYYTILLALTKVLTKCLNSLGLRRCGCDYKSVISEHMFPITFSSSCCEIIFRRKLHKTCDAKPTLAQVMAGWHQATRQNQYWQRSICCHMSSPSRIELTRIIVLHCVYIM